LLIAVDPHESIIALLEWESHRHGYPNAAAKRFRHPRAHDWTSADLEALYKDVHSHPELSMQETRTAGIAADRLRKAGYEVTSGVGKTGVVGLLRNGDGPTVMLRADMDALPIAENTGLAYASKATATDAKGDTVSVGHMCGHDMHVAWLAGAATLLSQSRTAWKGNLMVVFQPGEEVAQGAQAMIDDGLLSRFPRPDIVLGQHVMVGPAGTVAGSAGPITSAADSLQIRLFGRGAHGSMPQASIDPIVMAASIILRLQTIVSREVAANDAAVVTIGVLQAGTKENVIPDDAIIKLNVRTFDPDVRKHVLEAIERIVMPKPRPQGRRESQKSRRSTAIRSTSTTQAQAIGSPRRFAPTFQRNASNTQDPRRRARTSVALVRRGKCRLCSGS
jgi:hippurate hydrolase